MVCLKGKKNFVESSVECDGFAVDFDECKFYVNLKRLMELILENILFANQIWEIREKIH